MSAEGFTRLIEFHELLRAVNEDINVTRLHSSETIIRKHYIDSLIVIPKCKKAGITLSGTVMDLGSGGGFPGIPLAIALPGVHFKLVEGRRKRTAFLEEVKKRLNLENVEVISRKMIPEDVIPVDTVITRAFEHTVQTAKRVYTSLPDKGLLILMKGPNCDDEIREMNSLSDWNYKDKIDYKLPQSDDRRTLLIYEKSAAGQPDYREEMNRIQKRAVYIEAESNPKFKNLLKLSQTRAVRKSGQTILFGQKLVKEALKDSGPFCRPVSLLIDDSFSASGYEDYLIKTGRQDLPVWKLKTSLARKVSFYNTPFPALLLQFNEPASIPEKELRDNTGRTLVLPLQNPENLGAAIRSAVAFDVDKIILTRESAFPFHPECLRASAGTVLKANIKVTSLCLHEVLEFLNTTTSFLLQVAPEAEDITGFQWHDRNGTLVLGTEGYGIIRQEHRNADTVKLISGFKKIYIPVSGKVESLNATVSLSIALYEWNKSAQSRKTKSSP